MITRYENIDSVAIVVRILAICVVHGFLINVELNKVKTLYLIRNQLPNFLYLNPNTGPFVDKSLNVMPKNRFSVTN